MSKVVNAYGEYHKEKAKGSLKGAGYGAGIGAAVGLAKGRSARGALVGGAIGSLAGSAVGKLVGGARGIKNGIQKKSTLKAKAIDMAKSNDGKRDPGEAKKFMDNMKDLKNDGEINGNTRDSKAVKKDMKDGFLGKKASLMDYVNEHLS